ncbi:MAG: single-stranded-DNA-specific exonuclease RecJ [Candidatus Limnocylindrales bacterium]
MITSSFRWRVAASSPVDDACRAAAAERGVSPRLLSILASRGVTTADELARFLAPAEHGLHDPRLLPDAGAALRRVAGARARGERVLVYGDFDADGLTGLSILVLALRSLGLDAAPYVPERLGDGHGLSLRAIDRAAAEGRTLILTADCGTSSAAEIDLARGRGIDVLVTDHHHAATWPEGAVAVVNPVREDSAYPERGLTGAGVAWKVAHLLIDELGEGESRAADSSPAARTSLPETVRALADLALIGTVADVAPILGENRAIARLGLELLRHSARPGLAALLERAGVAPERLDLDDIGFAIAPRLNAAGRVGEAARAARLLLATDRAEADELAAEIETANLDRREMTRRALAEARHELGLGPAPEGAPADSPPEATGEPGATSAAAVPEPAQDLPAALVVRGEWPVGIVGLIAGRLAEDLGRPAVVATTLDADDGTLRASCRSAGGINLAEALIECGDLLIRHGGHRAAAGFDIATERWPEFCARFLSIAASQAPPSDAGVPELTVDLVIPADSVDYAFVREIGLLAPTGTGNPAPWLAVTGLTVLRVRSASGGHTQLVLRRSRDVLDAVAFRRPDLAAMLHEGDRIDVVARAASRQFGGFESMQLEVVDVAAEGTQPGLVQRADTAPRDPARANAAGVREKRWHPGISRG